jgi:hypothetical protein
MSYEPGLLELRVHERGEDQLIYTFRSVRDASEMAAFLREFFPDADFVLMPVRH